ncbi:MAG: ABC transporter permease [Clostridia bacterium]|nr:ABC transporter permease [Clostridia bacterium]
MRHRTRATLAALPLYLFVLVFVLGPLVYMLVLSFMTRDGRGAAAVFTLENYRRIFDPVYFDTVLQSLGLACTSTALVTLIGYPLGLCTAFLGGKWPSFFRTAQMIPYFVNSLLRLVGWIIIFRANGLLDTVLMALGVTEEPLRLLYTYPAVVVGMVYVLLPFMFLSVQQVALQLDRTLIEASRDLGAGRVRTFLSVILPLTLPGLKTGILLTFIPSMGLFFIASILGGSKVVLLGSLIEEQLMRAHNQPFAAALSVFMMLLTGIISLLLLEHKPHDKRTDRKNGGEKSE